MRYASVDKSMNNVMKKTQGLLDGFARKDIAAIKDVQDAEEIADGIRKLLKRFEPELEAVGKVVPNFKKYGYADK